MGSKIANKEHSSIIGTVDMIEYLSPGLYEMVITDDKNDDQTMDRKVEFVPREMEDILGLDDGLEDETAFNAVAAISKFNDKVYLSFFSPIVRSMVTETSAEMIRQMHPLRTQRYMFADINPMMWPVKYWADWMKKYRTPVKEKNVFLDWERKWSKAITSSLDYYRDCRDRYMGSTFKLLYENPWMEELFPESMISSDQETEAVDQVEERIRNEMWKQTAEEGGFEAAVIRIILAVSTAGKSVDQREYIAAQNSIAGSERLRSIDKATLKRLVKQQAAIIDHDKLGALKVLPKLLTRKADREKAFEIATAIGVANMEVDEKEQKMLDQIKSILKL